MASDFDRLLAESTKKGEATVHGVLMQCVDKHGEKLYSRTAGYDSLSEDAAPLRDDAVLKLGSATKLMTSIALLQCVERGLLSLDEPISRILPELQSKSILERVEGSELFTRPSKAEITARHLLTHMSGLGYWFTHPLLMKWKASGARKESRKLTEQFNYPLVFDPGEGWLYGNSLDWAGVAVSRLNNNVTLEDYMIDNIWKTVGRSDPYPTFHLSRHPEYEARLMQAAERTPSGGLTASNGLSFCAHLDDDEGGAGLTATMGDYVAVLRDLISDAPKMLKPETISMILEPQIPKDSPALSTLKQFRPAWDMVAGPVNKEDINHGLGGLLVLGETPEVGQPKKMLCWGGSSNIVWFICKDQGIAGFFATQSSPFGDDMVKRLVNAWKKDFWDGFSTGQGKTNQSRPSA